MTVKKYHEVAVSLAGVANAKAGHGDLLMKVPVAGRLPRNNGQSKLTHGRGMYSSEKKYLGQGMW